VLIPITLALLTVWWIATAGAVVVLALVYLAHPDA
jgi:hypothetical protein